MLWSETQGDMNVDDYVTKVTSLAKHLPDLDESMLRHALIRGLKPHICSHVLQADVKTMADLLHAARVAEMASSAADTEVSSTLEELRESNKQQLTEFQQLSDRIHGKSESQAQTLETSRYAIVTQAFHQRSPHRRRRTCNQSRQSTVRQQQQPQHRWTRRPNNNIIIPSDHPRCSRGRNWISHFQPNLLLDVEAPKPPLAP